MWIMTTIGFFSAVQKPGDDRLTIRARVRDDLEALAQTLPELGPIQHGGGTDYPYRARAPHAAFALALAKLSHGIEYDNFKNAVALRQGGARAKAYSKVWDALYSLEDQLTPHDPPPKRGTPTATLTHGPVPRGEQAAYGGVVFDHQGRGLLREPKNHHDRYVWTFAKGRPDSGETPHETALREVREETGQVAEILDVIPGWFQGGTSHTAYFLMRPLAEVPFETQETESVRWVSMAEAVGLIGETTNAVGRKRDLAVLEAARTLWLRRSAG